MPTWMQAGLVSAVVVLAGVILNIHLRADAQTRQALRMVLENQSDFKSSLVAAEIAANTNAERFRKECSINNVQGNTFHKALREMGAELPSERYLLQPCGAEIALRFPLMDVEARIREARELIDIPMIQNNVASITMLY